ncbi:MAG: thioredoxin family protein [Bacteroidaceae bacterium]|nr:thioredoxin family protein [Bacteroidaceae bacterium]
MKQTIIIALLALVWVTGQAKEKIIVWDQPSTEVNTEIEGYFRTLLEITRVELTRDETRVTMHVALRPDEWVKFASATHLVADGKTYALRSLDGMEIDKETCLTEHGHADIIFHFEPLPMKTRCFDFMGGDSDGVFKLLGIEDVSTRAQKMFPSYWRNVQTGDWTIGFYDDFVIYDCKFWNYKQREQKGDKYTIVMENEGKEMTINVDKNKNGNRFIAINGSKVECSYISTITLPDYPMKDTSTAFKDSHYKTDTVTLVGWLKDMPQWMKDAGRAYEVMCEHPFKVEETSSYDKMDSLGRFTIKIPLVNSSEVYGDWKRTYIRTLFEPGETYFLLYDFKGGHKMFMGKNCRLQNETLAHPIAWVGGRPEKDEMDEDEAMEFLETVKAEKDKAMQELEEVVAAHPNISDRYIKYLKGHYRINEGAALMQGRFHMKDRHVPADFLDYVNREIWQKMETPYTLFSKFGWFRRDFLGQLVSDKYSIKGPKYTFTAAYDMYVPILRRYRDAGEVAITDDEMDALETYFEEVVKVIIRQQGAASEEDSRRAVEDFKQLDCRKRYAEIREREDVKAVLAKEEVLMLSIYHPLCILDSLSSDQNMRDIVSVCELYGFMDHQRKPLEEPAMQQALNSIKMPAAKDFLLAEQKKYLDLQNRDISHSENLKPAEDVADMSDGEQILRKLIEPYQGKIILLDIWGTWCGPCKDALSRSQAEYKRLKDYDLVYLYLANNSSEESWKNVIKMYDVTGDNVVHYNLPKPQQSAIEHFIGVTAFPTYKLIDREGNVLDVNADPRDLEGLARLLEQMK